MKRINNVDELKKLRDQLAPTMGMRENAPQNIQVNIQMEECGIEAGARGVVTAICKEVDKLGLCTVTVAQTPCDKSLCSEAPVVEVIFPDKDKVTYVKMDAQKAARVVTEHVAGGAPVAEYVKA